MNVKQVIYAGLLAFIPLITFAAERYIAVMDLNVRSGAGSDYSILYTLQKGDQVEFLAKEGDWYRITRLGKPGYAHSEYLIPRTRYHTQQQRVSYAPIGPFACLALFVAFIMYRKVRDKQLLESVTESNRGTRTERDLVLTFLKSGIPAQSIFHDLYLETHKGAFSQIDLVVVTKVGVIVIEVKNYAGWIFGNGNQPRWTQVLSYGRQKYRFYNPILQNSRHIAELRKRLMPVGKIPFYSLVVFYGDCVLKEISFVPNGTFLVKSGRTLEVLGTILRDNELFHYDNEVHVGVILKEAVANGRILENQIQHKENIKDMLGKHRIFD